jgi:hypothetical protein
MERTGPRTDLKNMKSRPLNRRDRLDFFRWGQGSQVLLVSLCLTLGIVLAGCNSSGLNLASVEGVVTLDDKPVPEAAGLFLPDDPAMGPPASGTTDAEGRFTLNTVNWPGAPVGSHKVAISRDETKIIPQRRGFPLYKTTYLIPPKYADTQSSGLVANVTDGENTLNFSLSSH